VRRVSYQETRKDYEKDHGTGFLSIRKEGEAKTAPKSAQVKINFRPGGLLTRVRGLKLILPGYMFPF